MEFRARRLMSVFLMTAALAAGCSSNGNNPEKWVISPDAYGPITTDMTKAEILKVGPFIPAPNACPAGRLDWYSQTYAPAGDALLPSGPRLAMITLDGHGKPEYIDPNPQTQTDLGIRTGDTLRELEAAYGDRLIADDANARDDAHYAANGERSHLSFHVRHGKVTNFYLTPGKAADPYSAAKRGIAC